MKNALQNALVPLRCTRASERTEMSDQRVFAENISEVGSYFAIE